MLTLPHCDMAAASHLFVIISILFTVKFSQQLSDKVCTFPPYQNISIAMLHNYWNAKAIAFVVQWKNIPNKDTQFLWQMYTIEDLEIRLY